MWCWESVQSSWEGWKEEKGIQMIFVFNNINSSSLPAKQVMMMSLWILENTNLLRKFVFSNGFEKFQNWGVPKICPPQIFSPPKIFSTPLPPEGGQGGSNLATFDWFELLQKFQKCLIANIGPFGANIWHPQIFWPPLPPEGGQRGVKFCNFATAQRIWKIPKPSDP